MPSIYHFIQQFQEIPRWIKRLHQGSISPNNLVRLCRRRSEFISIINEAINSPDQRWSQDLVERVIKHMLEEASSGISVYKADTLDPFDPGHALAVIAEGISQDDFRSTKGKKRKFSCTRGSLIIPINCLPKTTCYNFTPENNLDFYPANRHHFDLDIDNAVELATAILDGIHQQAIVWTCLGNDGKYQGTYRLQAAIAYSHCLTTFGKLDPSAPPSNWTDGKNLTASEQIEILKYLAQTTAVDSPIPP